MGSVGLFGEIVDNVRRSNGMSQVMGKLKLLGNEGYTQGVGILAKEMGNRLRKVKYQSKYEIKSLARCEFTRGQCKMSSKIKWCVGTSIHHPDN
jgi:hypothetical protein